MIYYDSMGNCCFRVLYTMFAIGIIVFEFDTPFCFQKGDAAIHLAARCGLTDVIDQLWRHGDSVTRPNQVSVL